MYFTPHPPFPSFLAQAASSFAFVGRVIELKGERVASLLRPFAFFLEQSNHVYELLNRLFPL
jgi:hypothetical protein